MNKVSFLDKSTLGDYSNISELSVLSSREDVATLLDTFEHAVSSVHFSNIDGVVCDNEGFYYFVVSSVSGSFDLFQFINDKYSSDVSVNSLNANLLFPKKLSRGVAVLEESDDDDTATSYMCDKDVVLEPVKKYYLVCKSKNITIEVPEEGLILGRSVKKADFIVTGNTNVGRAHCKVYLEKGSLKVKDLESLNGTFINGRKVPKLESCFLKSGDILSLADEMFDIKLV